MPGGRIKGDHDARRAEIAEAACKVILKEGLAQASLSDIAREMGYTTGVLRHYFADKDELLLYAKNLLFDRSFEQARRAAVRCNGVEKLYAMARSLLAVDEESIALYKLLVVFNGHAIGNPGLMRLQQKRNERSYDLVAEVIMALQEDGSISKELDPRLAACGICAMLDGLADQVVMDPKAWASDELSTLLSEYIETLVRSSTLGKRVQTAKLRVNSRSRTRRAE